MKEKIDKLDKDIFTFVSPYLFDMENILNKFVKIFFKSDRLKEFDDAVDSEEIDLNVFRKLAFAGLCRTKQAF